MARLEEMDETNNDEEIANDKDALKRAGDLTVALQSFSSKKMKIAQPVYSIVVPDLLEIIRSHQTNRLEFSRVCSQLLAPFYYNRLNETSLNETSLVCWKKKKPDFPICQDLLLEIFNKGRFHKRELMYLMEANPQLAGICSGFFKADDNYSIFALIGKEWHVLSGRNKFMRTDPPPLQLQLLKPANECFFNNVKFKVDLNHHEFPIMWLDNSLPESEWRPLYHVPKSSGRLVRWRENPGNFPTGLRGGDFDICFGKCEEAEAGGALFILLTKRGQRTWEIFKIHPLTMQHMDLSYSFKEVCGTVHTPFTIRWDAGEDVNGMVVMQV